jgi:hypothetical protein
MKTYLASAVIFFFLFGTTVKSQTNDNIDVLKSFRGQFPETGSRVQWDEDPEGDALVERVLTGFTAGDDFGYSVSDAGDVNGDGYDDLIIGAIFNDAGGTSSGRAYIYFGGMIFNSSADVILTGDSAAVYLGCSVSSAGDVNGDGYDDVIVGAYRASSFKGKAYIYYGGVSMNNVPDVTLSGVSTNDNFGYSVSKAGDVNGDGFADVIVGAYGYSSSTGRAYIYFGGSSMNNTADVTMTGEAVSSYFGYSVSDAGDVNGDGFADVISGAYGYSSLTGRAYIYFGGSSMNSTADVSFTGETLSANMGRAVSSAGDIDGDGYSDVLIGSPGYSSATGRAYIFKGGASMNNAADVVFNGQNASDDFGISVSEAGDINGDGKSDVVIGAQDFATIGRVYVFKGGTNMDNIPDKYLNGEAAGDNYGNSVSTAGDINGDGYSDFVVGAELNDANGSASGRAYLYMNVMTGTDTEDLTIDGEDTLDYFGYSVSSAGDVNGDGFDDVIVGARVNDQNGSSAGKAYIYFGGLNIDYVADVSMTGVAAGDQFGYSVAGAGDVNGDGYDDVIVGAPFNDAVNNGAGRAYVFYGGAVMNNSADVILSGIAMDDNFGVNVARAGDVNGDGYSDVLVSTPSPFTMSGRGYIYFGGSPMNNTTDVTLTGTTSGFELGYSGSSAGDMNGDGYDDVILGLPFSTNGSANIYFGGYSMDGTRDLMLNGETSGDNFGISVSSAGDVNGDGYGDVIVGAYENDYSGVLAGSSYIFYGGYYPDSTADVVLRSTEAYEFHGYTVASAGDVNDDGYGDVLVSALDESPIFYRGSVYIYHGGVNMDANFDNSMSGNSSEEFFGLSAGNAGDMNGDGVNDLIIGAYGYSGIFNDAGRATIYLSSSYNIPPSLVSVKDVPLDQGGKVRLKWHKSGYDTRGVNKITHYLIYRSGPPGISGYEWEQVGNVSAAFMPLYTYTADTDNDSTGSSPGTSFFKIAARTANIQEIWESNVMSGYSVDNLAPFAPSSLAAGPDNNSINLTWNPNQEPDLHHYIIYRDGAELSTSLNNSYDDTAVLEDSTYDYRVAAVDVHGNISALSNIASATLNSSGSIVLTMIMEGFYNSASNNLNSGDTARLYLRNASAPYAVVDSSAAVINAVTLSSSFSLSNAATGSYYIVVKHRNSIETWSANPVVYTSGGTTNFSFITSVLQAFGSNMIQVDASPVRFAIYSGDVNQDGTVDATDVSSIDNDAFNFVGGYVVTDLTGDNFVDGTDFAIADNNAANFVSVARP